MADLVVLEDLVGGGKSQVVGEVDAVAAGDLDAQPQRLALFLLVAQLEDLVERGR